MKGHKEYYTTKSNIEDYLGKEITESLDFYIRAATDYINRYTEQKFIPSKHPETRYYDGNSKRELIADCFISLDSVKVNGEKIEVLSYPYNKMPKYKIISKNSIFPLGKGNVAIKGRFGWNYEIPGEIEMVATIIASGLYLNKKGGDVSSERIGEYSVSYKTDSQKDDFVNSFKILDRYRNLR